MKRAVDTAVLRPALLADFEIHHQNQARDDFSKLERIITNLIIPAVGQQHPISKNLYAHMENVRMGTQNFCWQHRHWGYSYSAADAGNYADKDGRVDA